MLDSLSAANIFAEKYIRRVSMKSLHSNKKTKTQYRMYLQSLNNSSYKIQ